MTRVRFVGAPFAVAVEGQERTGSRAIVKGVQYRLDVNSLHRDEAATELALNEIGRVRLRTTQPLLVDEYRRNRQTGAFILIDETTNDTVGAGMVVAPTAGAAA